MKRRSLFTALGVAVVVGAVGVGVVRMEGAQAPPPPFQIEEATIAGVHAAIRSGQTTCRAVVQAYIDRARAYNGVCTALVTGDGAAIPPAPGVVRAGKPIAFPTKTVAASTIFPDLDRYKGLPLDYGRMEPTISDPSVSQQMGMRVGIPNAGQVNALETINIRGERSVTCRGAFDAHPSTGPLPPGAPPECEAFRKQPDALERAAELDAQYGRNPDLATLPMYCVAASFKDPFETKDMRSTAGSDVAFAMDAPPFDSAIAARLREKGAIIYAKAQSNEFNAGPGSPGSGPARPKTNYVSGQQAISTWSGQSCNPYDTERVPRGSSSGSGVAVGANLSMISICEQTAASCQGPTSRNGIALILTTKGLLPDSGGIGNQSFFDRAGIMGKTLPDATAVLDALRDTGSDSYFDTRDVFSAIPKSFVSRAPYASYLVTAVPADGKPLQGMRIAILREHMVVRTPNHEAISKQIDQEIKTVLRDKLGAEIVETITPGFPDDAGVPNLRYTFADAFSETLPRFLPELFSRKRPNGELMFAVPGHDVASYDYLVKLSNRKAPLSNLIRLETLQTLLPGPGDRALEFRMEIDRYLAVRGDRTIKTWPDWFAHAKFRDDEVRAGAENWAHVTNTQTPNKSLRLAASQLGRIALLKVMRENGIDAFVHAENTVPTPKIGGANVGTASLDGFTPFLQIPRIVVPAGFNRIVYEPTFALNADQTDYVSVLASGTKQTLLPKPMPIAITFFAGQGDEPVLLKIGSAYESATKHRRPPPDFGPVNSVGSNARKER